MAVGAQLGQEGGVVPASGRQQQLTKVGRQLGLG
jgi:hypothetical protein